MTTRFGFADDGTKTEVSPDVKPQQTEKEPDDGKSGASALFFGSALAIGAVTLYQRIFGRKGRTRIVKRIARRRF